MRKIAFITGATSGIGKATAILLAENGYDIIVTGRRKERLLQLKASLTSGTNADILALDFDIRKLEDIKNAINSLSGKWKEIDILINNAGLSVGLDPIDEGEIDDWERMIDTNVKGLLYISRLIIPYMKARAKGHIVNIGSVAGKEVYENGNVYCATKFAVEALSKAMRIDLLKHNIKVTNISPGAVRTEFSEVRFKGDKERAARFYDGFTPLNAEDVADTVLYAISRPPHVNINDIHIMPTAQADIHYILKK